MDEGGAAVAGRVTVLAHGGDLVRVAVDEVDVGDGEVLTQGVDGAAGGAAAADDESRAGAVGGLGDGVVAQEAVADADDIGVCATKEATTGSGTGTEEEGAGGRLLV